MSCYRSKHKLNLLKVKIMKKAIITSAILLIGYTVFANTVRPNCPAEELLIVEGTFKEIAKEELPQAVQDAFAKDFKTATLNKAYVNDKHEYKLEFTIDGAASVVYADKDGNWIDKTER